MKCRAKADDGGGEGMAGSNRVQKSNGMSLGRWIPEHNLGETELGSERLA